MSYRVGTMLRINDIEGKVIGYIKYANPQDDNKTWIEYRLRTKTGECWLSVDDFYAEYSVSWPANDVRGQIGPEWHKVDDGTQVVQDYGGDVDVDPGERANFVEYEDEAEEKTLSVEIWSDGAEYSRGVYIEPTDIEVLGYKEPKKTNSKKLVWIFVSVFIGMYVLSMLSTIISSSGSNNKAIAKYLKGSSDYYYETTITGNEKQEAMVYSYHPLGSESTTDAVAKDIIDGIDGKTESVTQKDDVTDAELPKGEVTISNLGFSIVYTQA